MALRIGVILTILALLAGCVSEEPRQLGPDGRPLPRAYVISPEDVSRVTYTMLDSINSVRARSGLQPLALNAQLTAAAATHSRDMAAQNRPWHFGSDGSSPIERVRRTGYPGRQLGENISETYENEVETLAAWMQVRSTRDVILDPQARDAGFAWFQDSTNKIWWTLVTGG